MKAIYVAWQDPESRSWLPVGRLSQVDNVYRFVYTKGAEERSNFVPFARMTKLEAVYESNELFPIFANRLLPKSRPEYKEYLDWLNLSDTQTSPLSILSISGGSRATDSLEVFACPEPNNQGKYEVCFFNHGLSHLPGMAIHRVSELRVGERLFLMADIQNQQDRLAIALRTGDPATIVGYCPRYLTEDFNRLLKEFVPDEIEVSAEKINIDAPIQLRLLCKIVCQWPKNFEPCSSEPYRPIVQTVDLCSR